MAKKWGNLGQSDLEVWNNPCRDFVEYKLDPDIEDEYGVTEKRGRGIERVIMDSPEDAEWQAWDEYISDWKERGDPESSEQLTTHDGVQFYNQMREAGLEKSTIYGDYLPVVQEFLTECMKRDIVDANPIAYILDEISPPNTDKNYPEITVEELGDFFRWVSDPQLRATCVLMAKAALRVGETVNIDLPYLHLDHPVYLNYLEEHGIDLHDQVVDYPDSVYIPSGPTIREEFRGEVRVSGNKTAKGKLLPIDREVKRVLLDWFAIRPNISYPYPLFVGELSQGRLSSTHLRRRFKQTLREYDLAVEYIDEEEKDMDLHYFRHFFSTNMQDGQGTYEGAEWPWSKVKIIRGDITDTGNDNGSGSSGRGGDDLQDTYTHNWGDLIRKPYLRDVYNFGLYKPERNLTQ